MVESTIITIISSIIGLIIAFSIGNMSSAYRSMLQLAMKDEKKKDEIKKWAKTISNYLKIEMRWLISGLSILLILIFFYIVKLWEILQSEICFYIISITIGFGWIFLYVKETFHIQEEELNKLKEDSSIRNSNKIIMSKEIFGYPWYIFLGFVIIALPFVCFAIINNFNPEDFKPTPDLFVIILLNFAILIFEGLRELKNRKIERKKVAVIFYIACFGILSSYLGIFSSIMENSGVINFIYVIISFLATFIYVSYFIRLLSPEKKN